MGLRFGFRSFELGGFELGGFELGGFEFGGFLLSRNILCRIIGRGLRLSDALGEDLRFQDSLVTRAPK